MEKVEKMVSKFNNFSHNWTHYKTNINEWHWMPLRLKGTWSGKDIQQFLVTVWQIMYYTKTKERLRRNGRNITRRISDVVVEWMGCSEYVLEG